MIDFEPEADTKLIRERVTEFVADVVIPYEQLDQSEHGLDEDLRRQLQDKAKLAGVFAPQVAEQLGGLGMNHTAQAVILEESGYSLLGPQAMNCAAPDEGNMFMLDRVASQEQKERYLRPLAAGETRSCFAMTEPAPGAGSDPSMLQTSAVQVDSGWEINGRKWFTTGAQGAGFTICMARTSEGIEGGRGATMFLVDADNPGMKLERVIDASDRSFPGGHAEVGFENCFVPDQAVLGAVGEGFAYAQVRLAPARLTHCMRWLGLARRARDIALDRAASREAFGSTLGELGQVQQMLAESEIDLETSRLLILKCAWALDRGERASSESSVAKAFVAEAVYRIVDRSIQICGSLGVSGDTPLARYLNEVRAFRIYDGPTETHRWAIARRAIRRRSTLTSIPNGR